MRAPSIASRLRCITSSGALAILAFAAPIRAEEPPKEKTEKKEKGDDHEGSWKSCKDGEDGKPGASSLEQGRLATGCSILGMRIAFTGLDTVPARGITVGAQVHDQGEEFERIGIASVHATHRSSVGGGGSGFEGELGGSLTVGVRAPVAKRHGPFVRGGVSGHLLGNDLFYASLIELPRGEIGYQYLRGVNVVEVAATMGYAIDGRYGQRNLTPLPYSPLLPLSGFAWGGYVAAQVPHLRLGVGVEVVPEQDGLKGQVYTGTANACAFGFIFALCFDVRTMSEDGLGAFTSSSRLRTFYGGLTLGLSGQR